MRPENRAQEAEILSAGLIASLPFDAAVTRLTNSTASAGKGFRPAQSRGSTWKSLRLDCPGRAPAGMSVRRQAGTIEQLPLAIGEANFRAPGSSEYADRQHGEFKEVRTSPIHLRRHSRSGSGMAGRRGGLASSRNPHENAAVCGTAASPKFREYSDDCESAWNKDPV